MERQVDTEAAECASWGLRVLARLIDTLIVVGVWVGGDVVAGGAGAITGVILGFGLYLPLTHAFYGQTLGKRLLGLRLIKYGQTGRGVGVAAGYARDITMLVIAVIPFANLINSLRPLWNGEKQTWHDTLAGTHVVLARTYRNEAIPADTP